MASANNRRRISIIGMNDKNLDAAQLYNKKLSIKAVDRQAARLKLRDKVDKTSMDDIKKKL